MGQFGDSVNIKAASKDRPGQDLPILGQPPKWSPNAGAYKDMIVNAARKYGVPEDLAIRQAAKESAFRPDIVSGKVTSSAGAIGLFQFMPATAKGFKLNPTDPAASADTAMLYMSQLYKRFKSWKLAAWAYNWGQGNVAQYLAGKKTALPKETRVYGLVVADGWEPKAAMNTLPGVK